MPDNRKHRGPHPEDATLFSEEAWPALQSATADLCWLFDRGYSTRSALKLVGDRHKLNARQRVAVERSACPTAARSARLARLLAPRGAAGLTLRLDGYNVLTTVEVALGGGVILHARDEVYRDVASLHGTYRRVAETIPALELIGSTIERLGICRAVWYLDRPVSNSGRLKGFIEDVSARRGWTCEVEVVRNPDTELARSPDPIATADSVVLDACASWLNLARLVIDQRVERPRIVPIGARTD